MSARKKLRAIMAGKRLVLMPGAYDALSARIIESEGFEALVAGGYAGIGSMLAQADMGQSNMRDYADHYARMCAAVELAVYVDADTGFGGVNNVRQMVRTFEAAGVAGLFISDQVFPNRCGYLPGKQIVPVEQMLAKIKAALDARRDGDLFIAARTDAAGVEGRDSAIGRCQLFMEAGADMAKPMGVDTIADIKRVLREVGGPHMATLSQAAGPKARSLEELEAAGVCAATFPSVALFAAAQAVRNVLHLLKRGNSLAPCQEHLIPLDDYYELVGLKPLLAREESYDQAAAALARKSARRNRQSAFNGVAHVDRHGCSRLRRLTRRPWGSVVPSCEPTVAGFLQEQADPIDHRLPRRQRLRSCRALPRAIPRQAHPRRA